MNKDCNHVVYILYKKEMHTVHLISKLSDRLHVITQHEPRCEKTGLRSFRPGPTQTGLYIHRTWLDACNVGFRKKRDCSICVAKTKALISFTVTAKLIFVFVFAYAKSRFSHDTAHICCCHSRLHYKSFATMFRNCIKEN